MHVVCVLLQALCIFGLNCFLAGLSDAIECNCRIAIWQTQSCHGYYFCCVVWGKYRVCGVAFVWSCGCYVLSSVCQKECQKICQKACQKICQKECQKICQKECQKICCFALCLHDRGWIGRAKVVVWGKMWQHWCMFDVSDTGSVCLQAQVVFSVCSWYDCSLSNKYIYIYLDIFRFIIITCT